MFGENVRENEPAPVVFGNNEVKIIERESASEKKNQREMYSDVTDAVWKYSDLESGQMHHLLFMSEIRILSFQKGSLILQCN